MDAGLGLLATPCCICRAIVTFVDKAIWLERNTAGGPTVLRTKKQHIEAYLRQNFVGLRSLWVSYGFPRGTP